MAVHAASGAEDPTTIAGSLLALVDDLLKALQRPSRASDIWRRSAVSLGMLVASSTQGAVGLSATATVFISCLATGAAHVARPPRLPPAHRSR